MVFMFPFCWNIGHEIGQTINIKTEFEKPNRNIFAYFAKDVQYE